MVLAGAHLVFNEQLTDDWFAYRLRQQHSRRPPASPRSRVRRFVSPNFAPNGGPAPCPPARTPSRTRSLDVLDRESSPEPGPSSDEAAVVTECEQYLSAAQLSPSASEPSRTPAHHPVRSLLGRALSCDESTRERSTSALSLASNSSEPKRKRNFMDRCVNKVRSLIRK